MMMMTLFKHCAKNRGPYNEINNQQNLNNMAPFIITVRLIFWGFIVILSTIPFGIAEVASASLENLTEVAVFTTHEPRSAEFFKDYLYIADSNSLLIYNTSDPERPKLINKFTDFNEPRQVYGLSVSKNLLYIAAGPGWIYVLNLSNPEKPERMYQLTYLNSANDVAVTSEFMYIADVNTGMLIFNLTNRRNPELAGMFYILKSNISGTLQGWGGISVEVSGRYAFLSAAQRKGFYIIDVSDPSMPKEVSHTFGKNVYDIAISEGNVYLGRADGSSQFDLLDISNPYAPKIGGNFSIIESAERSAIAIHPSGDYIYAASGDTWHIFRIPDTLPPQIIIENPKQGEILTNQTINIAGTASDKSEIKEVLVNGEFAGTQTWSRIITIEEGVNNITIAASDINGNNITESIQVIYRPSVLPSISTPPQPVNVTLTPVQTTAEEINAHIPVFYGAAVVVVLIVLIYWILKIKR